MFEYSNPTWFMSKKPKSLNGSLSTSRLLDLVGSIHDLESTCSNNSASDLTSLIFASHWGHLSVIFLWLSGSLFHIGWCGNFMIWKHNPSSVLPISHSVWDPHISLVESSVSSSVPSVPSYSGIYNCLLSSGFTDNSQIYHLTLALEFASVLFLVLGRIHVSYASSHLSVIMQNPTDTSSPTRPLLAFLAYLESPGLRLNYHISSLIGVSSILWAGHLFHVSLPVSRGISTPSEGLSSSASGLLSHLVSGNWLSMASFPDSASHVFGFKEGAGSSLLTFSLSLDPTTGALPLTDIIHHHLSLGVLLVWAGHLYSSFNKGLGHRITELVSSTAASDLGKSIQSSAQLQLALALLSTSLLTFTVAAQMSANPCYPYLVYDYVTSVALFVHHCWIGSLLIVGAFAHFAIFLLRDLNLSPTSSSVWYRLILHKSSIIAHLSWVTLFLGFHTLGVFVHNDSVCCFGEPYKQILIEPVIAQYTTHLTHSYLYDSWHLLAKSSVTPGDFLSFHSVSLGMHVTLLILLKGSLDARSSALMPDKAQSGFSFSCDGPARGGTCDISSWDAFYLSVFWLLNANSWALFYYHWTHLLAWQSSYSKFEESSTYLYGWFRDYLWYNSASLIRGYDPLGPNDLSVWAWTFLAAHLCWATGFMFLISWRGYWQELIDCLVYMHLKTPFLFNLWSGTTVSPAALSILQARFLGLVHFSVGLIATYAAFVLGVTS